MDLSTRTELKQRRRRMVNDLTKTSVFIVHILRLLVWRQFNQQIFFVLAKYIRLKC